ncbi:MAG: DUF115 domain-containing protein [Spirochaetaceae bacterium]|jgi:hypothetical protein|nr:DUF115 domain-containing protein [Spirochaetaceae bacterium]
MQILPAKNGSPTLLHGKTWLHSRYNPEAEAEKYIASRELAQDITHFILIECALGYIIPVLRARFPGSVIVSLHVDRERCNCTESFKADVERYPETPSAIRNMLERVIPEDARIKIIEWRPSLSVYPKEYRSLLETAADFLTFHTLNKRTAAYFEQRWKKNVEYNTAVFNRFVCLKPDPEARFPVVVAAAGPGLMRSLPEIKKKRDCVYLVAVSSALAALYEHGIRPDMVAATDGGFWALPHLFTLGRYGAGTYPVIAVSLNARLPSSLRDAPLLPISDGSAFQNARMKTLRVPFLVLPQRGTVSAAALDVAFVLTRGPVYVAGLDLRDHDVISHASPHAFETLFRLQSNRLAPYYHEAYARSRLNAESNTQAVYVSWFQNNLARYAARLIALGDNHPLFAGMRSETIAETGMKGSPAFETFTPSPDTIVTTG